jgi:hypothetical protein
MSHRIGILVLVVVALVAAASVGAQVAADSTAAPATDATPVESTTPAAAATPVESTPPAASATPAVAPVTTAPLPVAPVATAAVTAQAAPAVTKPAAVFYEKARVVVDGQAQANGSFGMSFSVLGGETKSFTVNVLGKTKKNDVARDVHKELSLIAGDAYKVKLDGDKIQISKADKKTSPNFSLGIDKLELSGVSLRVEND